MSGRAQASGSGDPFGDDESIPLLTEVVPLPRRDAEMAAGLAAPAPPPAVEHAPPSAATPGHAPAPHAGPAPGQSPDTALPARPATPAPTTGPSQADWDALAERIERGVTARMLAQAGPMLENSLQTLVAPLIEQAAVQIAHDLHDVFSHLVQDLVARAVAEELALQQAREDQPPPTEIP